MRHITVKSVRISLISVISVLLLFLAGCKSDFSITGPSVLNPAPELSVCGSKFCLNGMSTFLVGISYYGGLTAPTSHIAEDLDDLKDHGFNWIRVWNTWTWTMDVAAVLPDGSVDEFYLDRLKYIIEEAGKRGMVVDVTLEKEGFYPWPQTVEELITVARVLAHELRPYRNVYFDIANEHNLPYPPFHVLPHEVGDVITAVKSVDPQRVCTASNAWGAGDDLDELETVGHVDFQAIHTSREEDAPRVNLGIILGVASRFSMPIHSQEPFMRGYDLRRQVGELPPFTAQDYLDDLEATILGGGAGWCLHNGSQYGGAPYKSFDMSEKRLFEQLDAEEMQVVQNVRNYN